MQLPLLTGVADELLLPNCEDYLLNTAQLIESVLMKVTNAFTEMKKRGAFSKIPSRS